DQNGGGGRQEGNPPCSPGVHPRGERHHVVFLGRGGLPLETERAKIDGGTVLAPSQMLADPLAFRLIGVAVDVGGEILVTGPMPRRRFWGRCLLGCKFLHFRKPRYLRHLIRRTSIQDYPVSPRSG